jgi:ATP-dependent DNA helicase RecQ
LENFTYGDTPDAASIEELVDSILANEREFDISTYDLSRNHDMRPLVVNTLLTYLELANVIEATAPFYSEYQFVPLKSSAEILARFDAERVGFLKKVFANAVKAKKWLHIDVVKTAERLETTRDRVVKALTYLEEQGDLTLKVAGLRQGYRIVNRPDNVAALKRSLIEKFETRERNDIARVAQVVALAEQNGCVVRGLLSYFGEELGRDCGHCGRCLGEAFSPVPHSHRDAKPTLDRARIQTLRREHPDALTTPRSMARFLCGLASPRLTQSKLTKHALFGSLADAPFQAVMSEAERV